MSSESPGMVVAWVVFPVILTTGALSPVRVARIRMVLLLRVRISEESRL